MQHKFYDREKLNEIARKTFYVTIQDKVYADLIRSNEYFMSQYLHKSVRLLCIDTDSFVYEDYEGNRYYSKRRGF